MNEAHPYIEDQTAVTNKEIADAFRKCLPYLWDGQGARCERPLNTCGALGRAYLEGEIGRNALARCKGVVMDRLEGNWTVADWLAEKGFIEGGRELRDYRAYTTRTRVRVPKIVRQIQQYRHAWVQALINEFEEKPDADA